MSGGSTLIPILKNGIYILRVVLPKIYLNIKLFTHTMKLRKKVIRHRQINKRDYGNLQLKTKYLFMRVDGKILKQRKNLRMTFINLEKVYR